MAGPDGNYPPGYLLETDKETACQLIKSGYAEATEPEAVEEILQPVTVNAPKKAVKK